MKAFAVARAGQCGCRPWAWQGRRQLRGCVPGYGCHVAPSGRWRHAPAENRSQSCGEPLYDSTDLITGLGSYRAEPQHQKVLMHWHPLLTVSCCNMVMKSFLPLCQGSRCRVPSAEVSESLVCNITTSQKHPPPPSPLPPKSAYLLCWAKM